MFIALVILLIIALFITVYYYKANRTSATGASITTTAGLSGSSTARPVSGEQPSGGSYNPGSVPDGTGQDKGNGNAAMSSGMQG